MHGVKYCSCEESNLEIRRIQASDVTGFLAMWKQVFSEGQFLAKAPPPEERVITAVARVVAEEIPNFVAIEGGKVVGSVEVFPGTMCGRNFEGADRFGFLGLQVDAKYRRKGIGRSLILAAISDSIRYGFESIELTVFESNIPALQLYDSLGFVATGKGKSITLPSGTKTQEQYMVLNLVHKKPLKNDAAGDES